VAEVDLGQGVPDRAPLLGRAVSRRYLGDGPGQQHGAAGHRYNTAGDRIGRRDPGEPAQQREPAQLGGELRGAGRVELREDGQPRRRGVVDPGRMRGAVGQIREAADRPGPAEVGRDRPLDRRHDRSAQHYVKLAARQRGD
jgi:hypothetical protein